MGQSGNPAIRSVSSAADFKKRKGGVFELPSGAVMRLKNPGGLKVFITKGIIPNSLMGVVQDALNKGKKMDTKTFIQDDGTVDPQLFDDMMGLLDALMIECAVQPKVHPTPTQDDLRVWNEGAADGGILLQDPEQLKDDNLLYVDEIDDEDKMFVFQWVTGGTSDLETFRKGFDQNVASLVGKPEVGSSTKRPARAAKG